MRRETYQSSDRNDIWQHGPIIDGELFDGFVMLYRWKIPKEMRGQGRGKKLYEKFEEWAKEQGASCILAQITPDDVNDREDCIEIAAHLGFRPFSDKGDHLFIKGLDSE